MRPMSDVASCSGPEQPPPDDRSRPRLDGATGGLRHPHRHDEFRPGYSLAKRSAALPAFASPTINLPRLFRRLTPNRTFLLCLDNCMATGREASQHERQYSTWLRHDATLGSRASHRSQCHSNITATIIDDRAQAMIQFGTTSERLCMGIRVGER